MLELVYPGEERSRLFTMLFLCCLPAVVRLQLTEDDHKDVRTLANKADRCRPHPPALAAAASLRRHRP